MQEIEIKILRLTTGEDIIGSCVYDTANSCVEVHNPMTVMLKRLPNSRKTMLFVSPWLPIEILDEDNASIDISDILTMLNPTNDFKEYYTNAVVEYETVLSENGTDIEEDDDNEEIEEEKTKDTVKGYKLH